MTDPAKFIRDAERLPAAPGMLLRLLDIVNDPNVALSDVASLIEKNPTLAVRILKLANSAFYGMRGEVDNVRRATMVLGFKTISSMATLIWTHTICSAHRESVTLRILAAQFGHAATTAVVANRLLRKTSPGLEEDGFLGGLLHDIGRIAMCTELGVPYEERVVGPGETTGMNLRELETRLVGFDHALLGAEMMRTWGLPEELAEIAQKHHDTDIDVEENPVLAAVALANIIATQMNFNTAPSSSRPDQSRLFKEMELDDEETYDRFVADCQEHLDELLAFIQ